MASMYFSRSRSLSARSSRRTYRQEIVERAFATTPNSPVEALAWLSASVMEYSEPATVQLYDSMMGPLWEGSNWVAVRAGGVDGDVGGDGGDGDVGGDGGDGGGAHMKTSGTSPSSPKMVHERLYSEPAASSAAAVSLSLSLSVTLR